MQLSRLVVRNFKAFPYAELELPPTGLVLLVGANNAGKTALLSAVDVVANLATQANRHSGASEPAEIRARFLLTEEDRRRIVSPEGQNPDPWLSTSAFQWLEWRYLERDADALVPFTLSTTDAAGREADIGRVEVGGQFTGVQILDRIRSQNVDEPFAPMNLGTTNPSVIQDADRTYFGNISVLISEWRQRLYHFRALRPGTERTHPLSSTPTLTPTGSNLPAVLVDAFHNNRDYWDAVGATIQEIIPDVGDLSLPTSGNEVALSFRDPVLEVDRNIKDLGTGVEQVLMTAYVGVTQPTGSLVIVEEPETNLHPEAQRRLLRYMLEWSAQRLFVVSTHSTIFLDRGAQDVPVWLVQREGSVATFARADTSLATVLRELGVRLSDVLSAGRVLIVEGPSDADILTVWFGDILRTPGLALTSGSGGDSAWQADTLREWVESADVLTRRVLFVRDRDELPTDAIAKLEARGTVYVLKRRELENYLFAPEAIATALSSRLAGAQSDLDVPSPDEIDDRLAHIAETLKPVVVLKRVAKRLTPVRLVDHTAVVRLAGEQPTLEALEEEISARLPTPAIVEDVRRWWEEEEGAVSDTWPDSWRNLAPGGDVLDALWSEFGLAYDKNRDGALIAESMTTKPAEIQELLEQFMR